MTTTMPRRMIDCGTLGASTTGVKMKEVVQSIRDTTKDHLDLPYTSPEEALQAT